MNLKYADAQWNKEKFSSHFLSTERKLSQTNYIAGSRRLKKPWARKRSDLGKILIYSLESEVMTSWFSLRLDSARPEWGTLCGKVNWINFSDDKILIEIIKTQVIHTSGFNSLKSRSLKSYYFIWVSSFTNPKTIINTRFS